MRALFLILALLLAPAMARAQLALPGAVAPTPEGQSMAPPPAQAPRKAAPAPFIRPKPPAESAILGQTLSRNGRSGALVIEKSGGDLRVTRLVLAGSKISHPNQSCEVAMGEDGPITLKPMGTPEGASRFELQSSACPLLIDLLGGAVRISTPFAVCAFTQADCRTDVVGVWGPAGASFSETQVKTFERERAGFEKSVQARFRELMDKYKKNPELVGPVVKEQADFGAARATACRDYDKEEAHGFCALRLTEARDLALSARLADAQEGKKSKEGADKKPRKPAPQRAAAPKPVMSGPPPAAPGLY